MSAPSPYHPPWIRLRQVAVLLAGAALATPAMALPQQAPPDSFGRQVRPILARHCLPCHGPDEGSREADLRLDRADAGGQWVIRPGDPANSEMIRRIESADDPMPPAGHARLSEQEIDLLKQWIRDGAPYQRHWAFIPARAGPPPEIPGDQWTQGPIDRFVLARMREQGLSPAGPADPRRLVRRVALDLTGLPPRPEWVERYAGNPDPQTWAAVVDEILADEAFGEHWASMWLDLARYADTVGYASDEDRTIWPWRDWVIRALNENMPWDRFTVEQLAGDLLPEPGEQQRLATAFHRNTLNNNEGGTNDEEFRTLAVKDRASTTAGTWLGLTLRCAECHSHKFDPISQTEYYRFLDFFNQTADADRMDEAPVLPLPGMDAAGGTINVPVMQELPADQRRQTRIMIRGNFRETGEAVQARVPEFLHPWNDDWPLNRLGLARWIVAADNPLTARVTVNRFWARLFGRGLVETEEDFGTQGLPPTHPDLLDWLALDFRDHGWDVKRLLRQLVLSSTYRQSAVTDVSSRQQDPENIWLARGPRKRLSAEEMRDQALAVSGLLSRKQFGPPVYPPNPIRVVTNAFAGADVWTPSEGEDRYRRALYTWLKRSQPHPLFETFDMATRDVCSLRRIQTNTPLQSLVTLNDEAFVEAAQALAKRMSESDSVARQLTAGYRRVLFRDPRPGELAVLEALYNRTRQQWQSDIPSARLMTGRFGAGLSDEDVVDLAALTACSNVILNLDSVLTR